MKNSINHTGDEITDTKIQTNLSKVNEELIQHLINIKKSTNDQRINELFNKVIEFVDENIKKQIKCSLTNLTFDEISQIIKPIIINESKELFKEFISITLKEISQKISTEIKNDVFSVIDRSIDMIQMLNDRVCQLNLKCGDLKKENDNLKLRINIAEKTNKIINKKFSKNYIN